MNTIPPSPLRQLKLQMIALGLLFVFIYAKTFPHLFEAWQKSDFSHGVLIPFISLYLAWLNRSQFRGLPVRPNFIIGIPLLLLASLALILSNRGGVIIAEELSMIIMIFGAITLLLGTGFAKVLAFPVGYLVFMVPVLDPIVNHDVFWRFQLATADIASYLLFFLKVPVLQTQQYLELPNMTLEVAQACSGVKFLISLIALTMPLAKLTQKTWPRKTILLLLAIVIAIATNGLRVALIGVWVYHFNRTDHIHGPGHILQGWFVALLGIILLFICARILQMSRPSVPCMTTEINHRIGTINDPIINTNKFNGAFIFMIFLGVSMGSAIHFYTPQPVHLKRALETLPLNIDRWRGENSHNMDDILQPSGADSELYRIYKDSLSGRTIGLYIGYFASQAQGKELINVTFNNLYAQSSSYTLKLGRHKINKAVISTGGRKLLILYWYDINGNILTNRYEAKIATAISGTIRNTTNGAIIMITDVINDSADVNELTKTDESFIKGLLPLLSAQLSH